MRTLLDVVIMWTKGLGWFNSGRRSAIRFILGFVAAGRRDRRRAIRFILGFIAVGRRGRRSAIRFIAVGRRVLTNSNDCRVVERLIRYWFLLLIILPRVRNGRMRWRSIMDPMSTIDGVMRGITWVTGNGWKRRRRIYHNGVFLPTATEPVGWSENTFQYDHAE